MIITIHLNAALDANCRKTDLAKGKSIDALTAFRELLDLYALKPEPLFVNNQPPKYPGIWHVVAPGSDTETIVQQLLNIPGVEAAYAKPVDDLPAPI